MRTLLREPDPGTAVVQQPILGNGTGLNPVRRILIAEDNPQLRQQLQELLSKEEGIAVDSTGDGTEALELLSSGEWKYSICLTDLKLPGLDGIQLVEEVQQRGLPVTVIVFTGYGSIQDAVL